MSKTDEYHKKYRYLIWRDEVGFLDLDNLSDSQISDFIKNLSLALEGRSDEGPVCINKEDDIRS